MEDLRSPAAPEPAWTRVVTACSDAEHNLTTMLTQPVLLGSGQPAAARSRRQRESTRRQVGRIPTVG